jgi:hypothetical protein
VALVVWNLLAREWRLSHPLIGVPFEISGGPLRTQPQHSNVDDVTRLSDAISRRISAD